MQYSIVVKSMQEVSALDVSKICKHAIDIMHSCMHVCITLYNKLQCIPIYKSCCIYSTYIQRLHTHLVKVADHV